jgi:hypothetical protein
LLLIALEVVISLFEASSLNEHVTHFLDYKSKCVTPKNLARILISLKWIY